MALVGTLGFNFQVVLPLLARFSFDGGAGDLRGAGLGDGGRLDRRRPGHRRPRPHRPAPDRRRRARLRRLAPCSRRRCRRWRSRSPILALLGAAAVTFAATINSTLQLAVAPEMRGRVMALYSVVFLGSTPIGGPLAGWLSAGLRPPRRPAAGRRSPASPPPGPPASASPASTATQRERPRGRRGGLAGHSACPRPSPAAYASRCSRPTSGTPRPPPSASAFRVRPGRRAPA